MNTSHDESAQTQFNFAPELKEEWRAIAGYEKFYEVSNFGNTKSLARIDLMKNGGRHRRSEKIIAKEITIHGYYRVMLWRENKSCHLSVARLVAEAFIANPENKATVNHRDGNKENNRVDNLEWNTSSENAIHRHRVLGKCIGEKHPNSKLKREDIPVIRALREQGLSNREIGERYGVTFNAIWCVVNGHTWRGV